MEVSLMRFINPILTDVLFTILALCSLKLSLELKVTSKSIYLAQMKHNMFFIL